MKLTQREYILALATAAAVLYGGSALFIKSRLPELRDLREEQKTVRWQLEQDRKLAGERDKWAAELKELSGLLSRFSADKKMDVHWLAIMDSLAAKHGINITKRQVGEEKKQGDVYELSIECKEWEGTLDGITRFLFDLQSEGAMFDIRQLLMKPKEKDVLRGRFLLSCAYTRDAKQPGSK